jgi:hypothetical protein
MDEPPYRIACAGKGKIVREKAENPVSTIFLQYNKKGCRQQEKSVEGKRRIEKTGEIRKKGGWVLDDYKISWKNIQKRATKTSGKGL